MTDFEGVSCSILKPQHFLCNVCFGEYLLRVCVEGGTYEGELSSADGQCTSAAGSVPCPLFSGHADDGRVVEEGRTLYFNSETDEVLGRVIDEGKPFYYNFSTGEPTLELPDEMVAGRSFSQFLAASPWTTIYHRYGEMSRVDGDTYKDVFELRRTKLSLVRDAIAYVKKTWPHHWERHG